MLPRGQTATYTRNKSKQKLVKKNESHYKPGEALRVPGG
jgi:hypothetical protein